MNWTESQATKTPQSESTRHPVMGGPLMQSIGAIAAIVLAVVGLGGTSPRTLAGISTICLGTLILLSGGARALRHNVFEWPIRRSETSRPRRTGASSSFIGGLAGIVLGILALLGRSPETLLGAAVITLGASVVLAGLDLQLDALPQPRNQAPQDRTAPKLLLLSWLLLLTGLGAVGLGITAVIGLAPIILALVGLICLGAAALVTGTLLPFRELPVAPA